MNFLPVPCPCCGGLVSKQNTTCTRCGMVWASPKELFFDGLCIHSERAYKIAANQEWTMENMAQGMQDVQDALALRGKYEIEIEKLERMEAR